MTHGKKTSRIDEAIDQNLRRAFEEVVNEKVPDRFTALLDELRAKEMQTAERQESDA